MTPDELVELARWRDIGRRMVARDPKGNIGLNADYKLAEEAAALLDARARKLVGAR